MLITSSQTPTRHTGFQLKSETKGAKVMGRLFLASCILPFFLTLTSCSTVKVDTQQVSKTLKAQRGSIVTQNTFSIQTVSSLMSYGIDSRVCLVKFDICLKQLEEATLLEPKREVFALLAELYYAKAKQIGGASTCQTSLQRLPVDPSYPNDYSSAEFITRKQIIDKACKNTYASYLISSIRYSYAYLFYNSLENDVLEDSNKSAHIQLILTDISVQTKDIYNAATSDLIKELYAAQADGFSLFDTTDLQVANLNEPSLNKLSLDKPTLDKTNLNPLNVNPASDITSDFDSKPPTFDTVSLETVSLETMSLDTKHDKQIEVLRLTLPQGFVGSGNRQDRQNNNQDSRQHSDPSVTDSNLSLIDEQPPASTTLSVYLPDETDYMYTLLTPYSEATGRVKRDNTNKSGLYSSFDLNYSGLNSVSKREGFGVSFVTLLSNRQTTSITDFIRSKGNSLNTESPKSRIYRTGNLLLTGIVIPKGDSVDEVLNGENIDVRLYNPRHVDRVDILGKPYALKANFSASYGLWLSENSLGSVGYINMLSRQQSMVLPQLFLLEPYDPNKRVVIMVHGLASSPATWVGITNDILNDNKLRESYQVWQVFYPTQIPMLENRYQIQKLLTTAFDEVDPNGQDIASQHSVIISHSMGAVLSRMMLSNDNLTGQLPQFSKTDNDAELSRLIRQSYTEQGIDARLELNKLEQVDKAVFISAPFRGTDFADKWFTRALRRIVQLPLGFIQTLTGNLTSIATKGELTANPLGALYLQNGASQLSDKSSFMQLTSSLKIDDSVTYHSIIANNDPDIVEGLVRLSNTDTKIDLSDYNANMAAIEGYDDPYHPDKIPLSDLNIDKQVLDKLDGIDDLDANSHQLSSALTKNTHLPSIATISVDGKLDPAIARSISDGIVPYTSAHLDGAKSETIISGGHGIQETPQAILLLRKILREHLAEHPIAISSKASASKTSASVETSESVLEN